MAETANLKLPLMEAAQSQKHVTHNEALMLLDAVVQLTVRRPRPHRAARRRRRRRRATSSPRARPAPGTTRTSTSRCGSTAPGASWCREIGWRAWVQDESRSSSSGTAAPGPTCSSSAGLVSWQGLAGGEIAQVGVNTAGRFHQPAGGEVRRRCSSATTTDDLLVKLNKAARGERRRRSRCSPASRAGRCSGCSRTTTSP